MLIQSKIYIFTFPYLYYSGATYSAAENQPAHEVTLDSQNVCASSKQHPGNYPHTWSFLHTTQEEGSDVTFCEQGINSACCTPFQILSQYLFGL